MDLVHAVIEHADDICLVWRVGRGGVLLAKLAIQLKRRRAAVSRGRSGQRRESPRRSTDVCVMCGRGVDG